jgi:hypothetical protein
MKEHVTHSIRRPSQETNLNCIVSPHYHDSKVLKCHDSKITSCLAYSFDYETICEDHYKPVNELFT